jgi:hypothetical protein
MAMRKRFENWHQPLDDILFTQPEEKADRALKELGGLLRALDDVENVGDELERRGDRPYGFVVKPDGAREDLYFRDVSNKILHAKGFQWMEGGNLGPVVKCIGNDPDRWSEAEIRIDRLVWLCWELVLG